MAMTKPKIKPKAKPISYYAAALKEAALKRESAAMAKQHKDFDAKALSLLRARDKPTYGQTYYG